MRGHHFLLGLCAALVVGFTLLYLYQVNPLVTISLPPLNNGAETEKQRQGDDGVTKVSRKTEKHQEPLSSSSTEQSSEKTRRQSIIEESSPVAVVSPVLSAAKTSRPRKLYFPPALLTEGKTSSFFDYPLIKLSELEIAVEGKELSLGGIDVFQSLPMPQCVAWCNLLKLHASPDEKNGNEKRFEEKLCHTRDLPPYLYERITTQLWPGHWFPLRGAEIGQWCSKTGRPALEERTFLPGSAERREAELFNKAKDRPRWKTHPLNASRYYHIHSVLMYQGVYFILNHHKKPADPSYWTLRYGGHFHLVAGLHPRHVYSSFPIYKMPVSWNPKDSHSSPSSWDEVLAKSGERDANLSSCIVHLDAAVYFPPADVGVWSYHVLGDTILPLLQTIRPRVMNFSGSGDRKRKGEEEEGVLQHQPTHLFFYRPMHTTYGFDPKSCHHGLVGKCLKPGNGGEFADLFVFIAGGLQYIHLVDPPKQFDVPFWQNDKKSGGKTDNAAPPPSPFYLIKQLFVGAPSNCELSTTTESTIIENEESVRLSPTGLDCTFRLYWALRDVMIRMVLTKRFLLKATNSPANNVMIGDNKKTPKKKDEEEDREVKKKKITAEAKVKKAKEFFVSSFFNWQRTKKNDGKRNPSHAHNSEVVVGYYTAAKSLVTMEGIRTPSSDKKERKGQKEAKEEGNKSLNWKAATVGEAVQVYTIIILTRRGVRGRIIRNEEGAFSKLMQRYQNQTFCHHREGRSDKKDDNAGEDRKKKKLKDASSSQQSCVKVQIHFVEIRSLSEAVFYIVPASLLILTHGAAMIYLPLLRPNAGVINLDYVLPTVVPMVPSWIHWEPLIIECVSSSSSSKKSKASTCNGTASQIVTSDMRITDENLQHLYNNIDKIMDAQWQKEQEEKLK